MRKMINQIRKHPVWYVTLCHYPEKYDDLLDEIHDKENKLEDVDYLRFELREDK